MFDCGCRALHEATADRDAVALVACSLALCAISTGEKIQGAPGPFREIGETSNDIAAARFALLARKTASEKEIANLAAKYRNPRWWIPSPHHRRAMNRGESPIENGMPSERGSADAKKDEDGIFADLAKSMSRYLE